MYFTCNGYQYPHGLIGKLLFHHIVNEILSYGMAEINHHFYQCIMFYIFYTITSNKAFWEIFCVFLDEFWNTCIISAFVLLFDDDVPNSYLWQNLYIQYKDRGIYTMWFGFRFFVGHNVVSTHLRPNCSGDWYESWWMHSLLFPQRTPLLEQSPRICQN